MLLSTIHIIVSALLIVLILLQERSAGLSGIFGGEGGGVYQTRRGVERMIFGGTIALAIIFAGLSILQLVL